MDFLINSSFPCFLRRNQKKMKWKNLSERENFLFSFLSSKKNLCIYTVQWYLKHAGFHLNDMKEEKIQTPTHPGEILNFSMTGCFIWCTKAQLATQYTTTHTSRVGSIHDLPALFTFRLLLRSIESGTVLGRVGL